MKKLFLLSFMSILLFCNFNCESSVSQLNNKTAGVEQKLTEENQAVLLQNQPPPRVTFSLERESLINRFKLMNDRSVIMYMYIFNYGIREPIGYYQVYKVSSVNSQLTNPVQIVLTDTYDQGQHNGRSAHTIPSPSEDGSYGTNGDAIFGFTPDKVYIEHNMQYIVATAPLNFPGEVTNLANIKIQDLEALKLLMDKIEATQ